MRSLNVLPTTGSRIEVMLNINVSENKGIKSGKATHLYVSSSPPPPQSIVSSHRPLLIPSIGPSLAAIPVYGPHFCQISLSCQVKV